MLKIVVFVLAMIPLLALVYGLGRVLVYFYHRYRFRNVKYLIPLSSHPYIQRLSRLDDFDVGKKRYANIPRDGNCGYHSIIYSAYEQLRKQTSSLHGIFMDRKNFNRLGDTENIETLHKNIQNTLTYKKTYSQVTYEEANDLVRWLKLLVAAHILESEGKYAGFISSDNTTVRAYVKDLLSTRRNFWMDFPVLCAITSIFNIMIVLIYVSKDDTYITKMGKEENQMRIFILNTNNRHFEPIFTK
ncbi:hypothetical protein PAEPH01_1524 [Pancytospora epiphaga]|nr:hypothetical protein PAEPH01_1524 [Pancytospora epiphaga]